MSDPAALAIAKLLAAACASISVANGYYTDVAATGVEPLAFTGADAFPQVVVHEESAELLQANATAAKVKGIYAVTGYVQSNVANAVSAAHKLRADILLAIGRFSRARNGQPVVEFTLTGAMDISVAPDAEDFVQATVRAEITYFENFPPPM